MLKRGYTRETNIRRDRLGHWFDGEVPIEHPNLIRSFASWIDRAPDGRFCLLNDIHWVYATIEGAPYFVRSVAVDAEGLELRLSGDRVERLDPATLRLDGEGQLWCDVRGGRVPARFESDAANQLADHFVEDDQGIALRIGDALVHPPQVEDPLAGWDPSKGHVES
tara:strand:+ start:3279 stop:3776 length:498 start_codon:yes stop_codon:yes gene_type:complete